MRPTVWPACTFSIVRPTPNPSVRRLRTERPMR
jgi:hypothetical protein